MEHKIGDIYELPSYIVEVADINGNSFRYRYKSKYRDGTIDKEWSSGGWCDIKTFLDGEWKDYRVVRIFLDDSLFEI